MRNLKKILALSLVFAMVFTLSFSALAATRKDFADGGDLNPLYNSSVDLLLQLGVLQGKPGGSLDPTGVYTRAEMAYLTAAIMLGGNISAAEPYTNAAYRAANGIASFSDVYDTDWYAGALYYLAHLGIVTGTGDGKFNPSGEAARLQVAAFALGIIGYRKDIQGYEGNAWTLNVQRDAAYCGLYTDISASETTITREQVFKMMDNALMNDSIDYNPVTGQSFYPLDANGDNVTVLELRFKQYKRLEGKFIANQYASLTDSAIEKGRIMLLDDSDVSSSNWETHIIDNVDMAKAPVAALGRWVAVFAKKTNITNRYEGLLGNVIPTDEFITIALGKNAADNEGHFGKMPKVPGATTPAQLIRKNVYTSEASAIVNSITSYSGNIASPAEFAAEFQKDDITEAYAFRKYGQTNYSYVFRNTWTLVEISDVDSDGKVTAVAFNDDDYYVFEKVDPATFENGANVKAGDIVFALLNSDDKPITVQPVENLKANLTSRTDFKVTLSGTVYSVNESVINCGDYGNDLLGAIVDAGNYGVQRDYFVWTNAVTGAASVVGYRGPGSADPTYCVVLDATGGTLNREAGVKLLLEDGTVGVYAVSSLKYITSTQTSSFADASKLQWKTTNGKEVKAASGAWATNTAIIHSAVSGNGGFYSADDTVFYQYEISSDGQSVKLTEADTTGAYHDVYGSVAKEFDNTGGGFSYKKGNSYIRNASPNSLWLNSNSLIFAKDGNNKFYCFKGFTAPDFIGGVDTGVYAQGRDGSVRFAFVNYNSGLGIDGKYGILTSSISVSGTDKNLTISFKMFDFTSGNSRDYTIANFVDDSGTILVNGRADDELKKGAIIEYTTSEDGVINGISRPNFKNSNDGEYATSDKLLASMTSTDSGWYTLYIANVSGFNAYLVTGVASAKIASGTAFLGSAAATNSSLDIIRVTSDTLIADFRNSDKPAKEGPNALNNKIWANAKSAASLTALETLTEYDGATVDAATGDVAFKIDVKLVFDEVNGITKAEAIVIRNAITATA